MRKISGNYIDGLTKLQSQDDRRRRMDLERSSPAIPMEHKRNSLMHQDIEVSNPFRMPKGHGHNNNEGSQMSRRSQPGIPPQHQTGGNEYMRGDPRMMFADKQ